MQEIWLPVIGYEGSYEISNFGNVKSVDRWINYPSSIRHKYGKEIKIKAFSQFAKGIHLVQCIVSSGYSAVSLKINSINKTASIHQMVATVFIENKNNLPQVNHIDGNKLNNHVNNLEWCTASHNMIHAFRMGLKKPNIGESAGGCKLTTNDVLAIRQMIFNGISQRKIAAIYGMSQGAIRDISNRKNWSHI